LAWTASAGVVLQYRIERKLAAGGDYALIDSVSGGTTAYQNTGLVPATDYIYRVEACGAVGCSEWSNEAGATTPPAPIEPPGVPSDLTGTPLSSTEIQLSWTAPGGQTSYEIRRRIGNGGQFTFVIIVAGDAITHLDIGLTPSTTYQYQIRACAEGICSDYSNVVSVRTAD
jgi:titin